MLRRLGFSKTQQTFMFDTVAGILHRFLDIQAKRVGNADGCEIKRNKPLRMAAKFYITERSFESV